MILPKLQMAVECLDMEHQNQEQQVQWRRDKTRCKSCAAKEKYLKYCKLVLASSVNRDILYLKSLQGITS